MSKWTKEEIAKSNWSGENAIIEVNKKRTAFRIHDGEYTFRLINDELISADGQWPEDHVFATLFYHMSMTTSSGGMVLKGVWTCEGIVSRDDADPIVAAAQVLFNII